MLSPLLAQEPDIEKGQVVLVVVSGQAFSGRVDEISPSGTWVKIDNEMPNAGESNLRWILKTNIIEILERVPPHP